MSLLNPWGIFTGGIDLDEEQRRSDALDAAKAVQDDRARARGLWTPEQSAGVEQRAAASVLDVDAEVSAEFNAGLSEGVDNVRKTIGGAINTTVFTPLKLIPWQLWIIGAVVLFFYLGGGVWLLRQAKGKLR